MRAPAPAALLLAAAALLAPACRTETVDAPAGLELAQPVHLAPQRTWRVLADGRAAGVVVCFAPADAPADPSRQFFSVRNALQQELGCVDGLGRAWRYEVHGARPTFVGSGTLLEGARAILSLGASAELIEVAIRENAPVAAQK